jgi:hypothetical protein
MNAAEYNRLAADALALAAGSALENVRDKHQRAADVWLELGRRGVTRLVGAVPELALSNLPERLRSRLLTSEQKLAAIRLGEAGSYNFWRLPDTDPEEEPHRRLMAEAHRLARTRGYFHRLAGDALQVGGLLVTIQADASPSQ